ncbi:cytochrome P450 [Penicillium malachiteum]|uniref:cytochrome P450 n=1 Tax=Penicillium malachiteum TaxID=1324776 RepID=UPI002546F574|nr:cytochrome P450 [Penicillium malachiteum]KAJ5726426.1 cytochrome P450 [Penicillium malachiteum]
MCMLEVYGPCISTANGLDWARHRKIVATPFNKNIMSYAWDESVEQSRQMLDVWAGEESSEITSVSKDTRTVSLNVLAATGFRKSYPFRSVQEQDGPASYRDSLQTILDNAILLMVAPRNLLGMPFAPKSWQVLGKAAKDFKNHMLTMLNDETKALNKGKPGSGSLMTTLVRAMDIQKASTKNETSNELQKGLSVDEIFEVQDWVAEELEWIPEDLQGQYSEIYPKLNRCRVLMLETLRIFPPVPSLPKLTCGSPQTLKLKDKTIVIPQNSELLINLINTQNSWTYWADPFTWRPARWVTNSATTESDAALLLEPERILTPKLGSTAPDNERLVTPSRCTYFPWANGGHSCPGNKFSQVEFVAVMAKLLRHYRVRAVPNPGETSEQTRNRTLDITQDVDLQLLLRMRDGDQKPMRHSSIMADAVVYDFDKFGPTTQAHLRWTKFNTVMFLAWTQNVCSGEREKTGYERDLNFNPNAVEIVSTPSEDGYPIMAKNTYFNLKSFIASLTTKATLNSTENRHNSEP